MVSRVPRSWRINSGLLDLSRPRTTHSGRWRRRDRRAAVLTSSVTSRRRPAGGVDAERPRAARRDQEEREAVHRGQLTFVLDREERLRLMDHEVRERHETTHQERRPACEQADAYEQAAERLDPTDEPHQLKRAGAVEAAERAEELLRTVARQEEPDHDPHERIHIVGQTTEISIHRTLPSSQKRIP